MGGDTAKQLSVREVSGILGVPERTIRHWARTSVLRARKGLRKLWRFDPIEIERSKRRLLRQTSPPGCSGLTTTDRIRCRQEWEKGAQHAVYEG